MLLNTDEKSKYNHIEIINYFCLIILIFIYLKNICYNLIYILKKCIIFYSYKKHL